MSRFPHFATVAVLAAGLAPFAAQARSAGHEAAVPAEVLIAIPGVQPEQLHGRAADRAAVTPGYRLLGSSTPEFTRGEKNEDFAG